MALNVDWGGTTEHGFTPVARIFLRSYTKLGLGMDEAMFVIQVLDFQWGRTLPHPKVDVLAEFMGRNPATIRQYIRSLRSKGCVVTRMYQDGRSSEYDFQPLFDKLKALVEALEPENVAPEPTRKDPIGNSDSPPIRIPDTPPMRNPDSLSIHEKRKEEIKNKGFAAVAAEAVKTGGTLRRPMELHRPPAVAKEEKLPEDYNCNDMEGVFKRAWKEKFNTPTSSFTIKDRKHAKDLIDTWGALRVIRVIRETILKWDQLRVLLKVTGFPSMALIFGYRNTLFQLIEEGLEKAASTNRAGAQYTGRDAGNGWG